MSTTLGERLHEVMQELGIESPRELAKFCGVTEGLVSQWFSGQTKLGPKPLLAFSRTQFNLEWLLEGKLPKYSLKKNSIDIDAEPADEITPRQKVLLGLFEGLTDSQQDALIRELQEKKQQNDELLTELLKRKAK